MRKFFSTILMLLIILLLPIYLIILNTKNIVYNPQFIIATLRKADIYEKTTDLALANLIPEEGLAELSKEGIVSKEELKDLIKEIIPPSFIQTNTENAIDELFSLLNTENKRIEDLDIVISLKDIKNRAPEILIAKIKDKYNLLPICTASQQVELEKKMEKSPTFPTCQPEGVNIDEFTKEIEEPLNEITTKLPDELDVSQIISGEQKINIGEEQKNAQTNEDFKQNIQEINKNLATIRDIIKKIEIGLQWLLVLIIILFILIILINLKHIRSALRFTGFSLFIPGLFLTLATSSLTLFTSDRLLKGVMEKGEWSQELSDVVSQLVSNLTNSLVSPLRTQSIIILAVGLVLLVTSFFIKKMAKPKTQ